LGLALLLASVHAGSDDIFYHYDDAVENEAVSRSRNVAVETPAAPTRDLATREEITRIFYFTDEWADYYKDLSTTLYPRSFQIPTAGLSNPKFKLESGSANVTETGLVLPSIRTWWCVGALCSTRFTPNWDHIKHDYFPSVANISVTDGDDTQYYLVNVTDYADYFSYNKMSDILSRIIQDGMTQYQKLEAITRWIAENTDYGANNTAIAVMVYDAGNYYGLSKAIVGMAQMCGINASTRWAGEDPGEFRGQNVLAIIDGKFIVADAGFSKKSKTRPREYAMYELDQGFTMYNDFLVQYDGWNKTVIIPTILNNTEVHGLGRDSEADVFTYDIEEVHLPATLKSHVSRALDYHIEGLRWIEVDPQNEKYSSLNGVLYMNNKTTLVLAPRKLEDSVTIHENTTALAIGALAYRKQQKLVIPSHVTSLRQGALFYANISEITIEPGLTFVGEACFKYTASKKVVLPDTVTSMDQGPFYFANIDEVVLSKNCPILPNGVFQESYVYKAVIPQGVEVIGGRNFYHSRNLINITLPNSVKSFKTEAFSSSSIKNIFYEGTKEEWCNITMVTAMPKTITVIFSNGENATASEACNGTSSSSIHTSIVAENSESKPSTSNIHTSKQSDASEGKWNTSATFLSDCGRQMISAVFVLFTMCLCLIFQ